jgi:hypothetical protein
MTTEQINEARNRPWADVETIGSDTALGAPTSGRHLQPQPPADPGRRGWAGWPSVISIVAAVIALLVLAWGGRSGQLEVTVERKRAGD